MDPSDYELICAANSTAPTARFTPAIEALCNMQKRLSGERKSSGVGINMPFQSKKDLFEAAKRGDQAGVRIALNEGAKIDSKNARGETALMLAARNGHTSVLTTLLKCGASVNVKDREGDHALSYAALGEQPQAARVLVEAGADLESRGKRRGTALDIARKMKSKEVVTQILIAMLNCKVPPSMVEAEVQQAIDCEVADVSLIDAAAQVGRMDVVTLLIDSGMRISPTDESGRNAILNAARNGHAAILAKLIDRGLERNARNAAGIHIISEALVCAANDGHCKAVQVLLDRGADVRHVTEGGKTALISAAQSGTSGCVKSLLESGAKVDSIDRFGNTALNLAARGGHLEAVMLLLNHKANVQIANLSKCTPLISAAKFGHVLVARALLDNGALCSHKDSSGKTALDIARANGHLNMVEVLMAADKQQSAARENVSDTRKTTGAMQSILGIDYSTVLVDALERTMTGKLNLTITELRRLLVPQHITDVRALMCAHNLILMAMRADLIPRKDPWRALDADNPSYFISLYHSVYDRLPSQEASDLAIKIARHAEMKGIVSNGFHLEQSIVLNNKLESKVNTIGAVIADLYSRVGQTEVRIEDLESNVRNVQRSLEQVRQNFKKQKKLQKVSALARFACSFIPLGASAAAEAVCGGVELAMGLSLSDIVTKSASYLVDKSLSKLTSVDLSDMRIAQFIISEEYQSTLPTKVRQLFAKKVEHEFGTFARLEEQLVTLIREHGDEPLNVSVKKVNIEERRETQLVEKPRQSIEVPRFEMPNFGAMFADARAIMQNVWQFLLSNYRRAAPVLDDTPIWAKVSLCVLFSLFAQKMILSGGNDSKAKTLKRRKFRTKRRW